MIAERLGHVPEPGETLSIDGVALEVEEVAHHVVTKVLAESPPFAADSEEDDDVLD